jgi:membrane-associated phospholipid phosphatase
MYSLRPKRQRPFFFFFFLLTLFHFSLSTSRCWGNYLWDGALSPFTTDAKYYLMAGSMATLTVYAFRNSLSDNFNCYMYHNKPMKKSSQWGYKAGEFYPNAMYVVGQGIAAALGNDQGLNRAGGMLMGSLYSGAISGVLKHTIKEGRPNSPNSYVSFPSGHATVSFAFGAYVAAEHGWYWGVPAILLASFVGLSRVNDGGHYLHDVFAGATLGITYGVGIQQIGERRKNSETVFFPVIERGTYAFQFSHAF